MHGLRPGCLSAAWTGEARPRNTSGSELLSVPKEALDKERWLHLLAAYDPDGSGEIPVSEVVTDALQPVAVELITCLARTVHTLSAKVLPYWLYMDSRSPGP